MTSGLNTDILCHFLYITWSIIVVIIRDSHFCNLRSGDCIISIMSTYQLLV